MGRKETKKPSRRGIRKSGEVLAEIQFSRARARAHHYETIGRIGDTGKGPLLLPLALSVRSAHLS